MTNMQHTLARNVPAMGKLIDGLKHTFLGDSNRANGSCPAMLIKVQCARCGEIISVRVDKANDLLAEYPDSGDESEEAVQPEGYTLHKEVVGRKCQNLVRFRLDFDSKRRIINQAIEGGELSEWHDTE